MGIFDGDIDGLDSPVASTSSGNVIPRNITPYFGSIDYRRQGPQGDVHWKLETIEPVGLQFQNFVVSGQLPVSEEGITLSYNQVVAETGVYGLPLPFVQWVRGEVQIVTFDVMLFSRDKDEDILTMFNEMARVTQYIDELKRIPLCRFTYGNILSIKCLVGGFGEVKIARPRNDGKARKIEFTLTLKRYQPYELKETDPNKPVKKSRMQVVSGDERMYEILARKEYGFANAIYGDRLRKLNRAEPFAVADEGKAKIPKGKIILAERIQPEYHAFNMNNESVAEMFLTRAVARNGRTLVI